MNPRVMTIVTGVLILAFGLGGLAFPRGVLDFLDYSLLPPANESFALGEIRAVYGGLFAAMGACTVFVGINPSTHRGSIVLIGLLFLGLCAGRLLGVYVDGDPGLWGWGSAALELLVGLVLVAAGWSARPTPAPARVPASVDPV